ncbi:MAG TPA: GIY-YIG nuclease family protein [Azonexus sp.]|nr:GIY-YIG nuclease family protein [Azonexus sp.]
MHEVFRGFVESLEPSFQRLMEMEPVSVATLPREMPQAGIYLFSEGDEHLYVGRTNTIKMRLQNHCRPSSGHNSATFAFRLARQITGMTQATYTADGSRGHLETIPEFSRAFTAQKQRVRNMDVRFVSEPESMHQALLEMYVAVSLGTPHNDFDNH